MRRKPLLMSFLIIVVLIVSPAAAQSTRSEMIISTTWLAERLDGKVILIDVAAREDYERAHITRVTCSAERCRWPSSSS